MSAQVINVDTSKSVFTNLFKQNFVTQMLFLQLDDDKKFFKYSLTKKVNSFSMCAIVWNIVNLLTHQVSLISL